MKEELGRKFLSGYKAFIIYIDLCTPCFHLFSRSFILVITYLCTWARSTIFRYLIVSYGFLFCAISSNCKYNFFLMVPSGRFVKRQSSLVTFFITNNFSRMRRLWRWRANLLACLRSSYKYFWRLNLSSQSRQAGFVLCTNRAAFCIPTQLLINVLSIPSTTVWKIPTDFSRRKDEKIFTLRMYTRPHSVV